MADKINTIKETYETNFGSAYETYKEAIKKDNSIRLQDVKDYMKSREDKQTHFKYKKYNSFVSPGARYEFEIDLMDMGTTVKPMRYGLVAVDNFTKMASVIPVKNKQVNEIMRGLEEVFSIMGTPKQIYSDEEGAMNSITFLTFINKHKFKHVQTSTHAHAAERFIQTFRSNLQRRLDVLGQNNNNWTEHVQNILTKYNNTIHSTIEIKPVDAVRPENHLWVSWHLWNSAKRDRKYEEIKPGDYVRVNIKPKSGITKGHHPKYSSTKHKVISIKDNDYLIDIMHKHKLYHRHEMLLV